MQSVVVSSFSPARRLAFALVALPWFAACSAAPMTAPPTTEAIAPPAADEANVPAPFRPFVGRHRGTMRMLGAQGEQRVPMGLDVLPVPGEPSMLTWVLRYGDGETAQVRDYRLLVDDAAAGRCRIDERNGIVLPARLFGDELVSIFVVPGQTLVVRYRAVPGGVDFVLEAFDPAKAAAAGADVRGVAEFRRQQAALRRTNAP